MGIYNCLDAAVCGIKVSDWRSFSGERGWDGSWIRGLRKFEPAHFESF
jgi:hypothetical protein